MTTFKGNSRNGETGDPYLVFRVRQEECAIPAPRVHEIRTIPGVEASASAAVNGSSVCGSIALHGRAIPVIDLGEVLGHGRSRRTGKRYVIVLTVESSDGHKYHVGWMVDAISKVVPLRPERILPVGNENGNRAGARVGRLRISGRFKYVLNPDAVLDPEELAGAVSFAPPVIDCAAGL